VSGLQCLGQLGVFQVLCGHLVTFHLRGKFRRLRAEFFDAGRCNQLHALLVFDDRLVRLLQSKSQLVQPGILGGDGLNTGLQVGGVRADVVGVDAIAGENFVTDSL
jgi:hypothetical protein